MSSERPSSDQQRDAPSGGDAPRGERSRRAPDGPGLDEALAALHAEHRDAVQLLGVLAFLAAEPVPAWLPAEHPEALPAPLSERARAGEEALLACVAPLGERGLAGAGERSLRVPAPVADAVRRRMSQRERGEFAGAAVHLLFRAFPDRVGRPADRERVRALAPHVLAAAEHPRGGGRATAEVVHTLARLGAFHRTEGEPEQAEAAFRTALRVADRGAPVEGPLRAVLTDELASVLAGRGEAGEAAEMAARAVELAEESLEPDSPQLPLLLSNSATTFREVGELERAAATYRRAVDAAAAAGADAARPLEAELLAGLADVELARGAREAAEEAAEAALAAAQAAHGEFHPQTARSVWMLGDARRGGGRAREATGLFRRALEIEEELHGPEHPSVGQKALGLARHLEGEGHTEEARAAYRRAASAFSGSLGPESDAARAAREHLEALEGG